MPGLLGETANLIVALKLDDSGFSGKLNAAARTLKQFDAPVSRIGRGTGQVASGLAKLATTATVVAGAGLGAVVKTAVDFEDAFAGVRKTVDATDSQLAELQDQFREMARTIPLSFEELSGIGEQAGALGIATANIEEFTRVSALLGVTTDVSAQEAATALGQLSNVLQLTGDDYDNFAATLVDLGNKGASTESQILNLAARAGAGAHLIGIANDQTLGWASAVANLGIEVEAGGTALQKFFLESLRNIQDDDTLQVMAETAGTTGKAFKQAFEKDASGALTTFLEGLGELSQAEQLAVLDALGFSDQRITRALLGLANNTDNLTGALDIAGQAWKDNTALTEEARKRFETTAAQIQLVKNNLRDAAYTIGYEVLPIVKDLSTEFVEFLNKPETQRGIKEFAENLAGGIRGLVAEFKDTDFSGLIGGMKLAADVAKGAFDAFRSLPAPIQQLAVAALVTNKVSGGAIGQIAKGLGNIFLGGSGTLAKLFGGLRGTPGNPQFVYVVNKLPGDRLPGVPPTKGAPPASVPPAGIPPAAAGTGALAGLLTVSAGILGAITANLIIPELTKVEGAKFQTASRKLDDGSTVSISDQSLRQMTALIPNYENLVKETGGKIASNVKEVETANVNAFTGFTTKQTALVNAFTGFTTQQQTQDAAMQALLERQATQAASSDAAMLGSLSSILAQSRTQSSATYTVADRIRDQRQTLQEQKLALDRVANQGPPRVTVDANVTVNTYVSSTMLQRQSSRTRVASGYRGGNAEFA